MLPAMDLPEIEQRLRELVGSIPPEVRPILLEVPHRRRGPQAAEIGNLYAAGVMRSPVELLIDAEADSYLRAALIGMLREGQTQEAYGRRMLAYSNLRRSVGLRISPSSGRLRALDGHLER